MAQPRNERRAIRGNRRTKAANEASSVPSAVCVGLRWRRRTEAITLLLGPDAFNAKKDLEEGAWERRKLIWGLQYDTDLMQLSLPGPKLEKAHFLLSLPEFDYTGRNLPPCDSSRS